MFEGYFYYFFLIFFVLFLVRTTKFKIKCQQVSNLRILMSALTRNSIASMFKSSSIIFRFP